MLSYRHQWNLMRSFSLPDLVLRLVYVSHIQVGNRARPKFWQKIAHMVSAGAASVSTSAAAWRDVASSSHIKHVSDALRVCWGASGENVRWWLRSETADGKVVGFCNSLQRRSGHFLGKGGIELRSGICSLIVNFVMRRSSVRNCKVSCWSWSDIDQDIYSRYFCFEGNWKSVLCHWFKLLKRWGGYATPWHMICYFFKINDRGSAIVGKRTGRQGWQQYLTFIYCCRNTD